MTSTGMKDRNTSNRMLTIEGTSWVSTSAELSGPSAMTSRPRTPGAKASSSTSPSSRRSIRGEPGGFGTGLRAGGCSPGGTGPYGTGPYCGGWYGGDPGGEVHPHVLAAGCPGGGGGQGGWPGGAGGSVGSDTGLLADVGNPSVAHMRRLTGLSWPVPYPARAR